MSTTATVRKTGREAAATPGRVAGMPLPDGEVETRRLNAEVANLIMKAHASLLRGEYYNAAREARDAAEKAMATGGKHLRLAAETYVRAAAKKPEFYSVEEATRYGLSTGEVEAIAKEAKQERPELQPQIADPPRNRAVRALGALMAAQVLAGKREWDEAAGCALGAAENALQAGLEGTMKEAAKLYLRIEVLRYNTILGQQKVGRYGLDRDEANRIIDSAERERKDLPKPQVYDF